MLKRIACFLFIILFFNPVYSQRPDWDKVAVTYMQLPLMPVSPMAKEYFMEVYATPASVLTTVNYTPVTRDLSAGNPILKIAGCTQVTATVPAFTVLVTFTGFNITQVNPESYYTTVNGVSKPQFKYTLTYLNIATAQIINASGSTVRQYVVADTDHSLSRTSQIFNSKAEADAWWYSLNSNSYFLQSCDNEAYQHAVKCTQTQLNSELGYQVKTVHIDVASMQKNKSQYDDLIQAFSDVSRGYDLLSSDKDRATDYLLKAIAAWEKALQESDLTNKKARINEHITAALYENLGVAYCFLEEWELSQKNILQLEQFDVGGSMKNKINKTQLFKADYAARIAANKMN